MRAALTVAQAMTSLTDMPKPSNFDMQFGKSTTPVVRLMTFQSVENVSGQKPWPMICSTMSQRMWSLTPLPTSNTMPRRRAASTSGSSRPLSSTIAFGGGANMCVTMSPGFKQRQQLAQRRRALPHVDHDGQAERLDGLLRALQDFDVVRADDGLGEPRLDADDVVAVPLDGGACRADVGQREVLRVAVRQNSAAADVDEHAPRLRRGSRDRDDGVDAVGAGRARVDPARDAVAQQHRRAFRVASRMRMDVDQAGHDELAARVERRGRLGGERGFDGGDSAGRDADVADGVEPQRRVDDAPASDDEVIARGLRAEPARSREQRRARGGIDELASIHCRSPSSAYAPSLASLRARVTVCQSEKHAAAASARPVNVAPSLWTNGGNDDEKLWRRWRW